MKKHDFKGKNVVITGASTGIGRALAFEFAKRGANLAITALPNEKKILSDLAKGLEKDYKIKTWTYLTDLTKAGAPEKLHGEIKKDVKKVYTLVNNAGTVAYGKAWEIDWMRHQKTLELNLTVPTRLMYLFLPDMVKRGEGVIFNTSSVSALQPTPFHSVYGATKAGLQSLSQGLRAELRGTGVSVCTFNPPYTDTAILRVPGFPKKLRWYTIGGGLKTPEWVAKKVIRAFEKGKFMYLPGLWTKFIHLFLQRFSPRRLVDLVAYLSIQGGEGQDTY